MDVKSFLEQRTAFLRYYYRHASAPFLEIQRKIETKESPFEEPYFDPETDYPDEPPYMIEWSEAADALNVLGRSCIATLSASMKLYFVQWVSELGINVNEKAFKSGFLDGYRTVFGAVTKQLWDSCPADLAILEQVVLARNNDQHPETITSLGAYHQKRDREKHPDLFFLSETDRRALAESQESTAMFMFANRIEVTKESLFRAIDELEKLVDWLEPQLMSLRYGNRSGFS